MLNLSCLPMLSVSGNGNCSRKDCEVSRMYLTWETFETTWFPILFALGIYCLIDGLFETLILFNAMTLKIKKFPFPYNWPSK